MKIPFINLNIEKANTNKPSAPQGIAFTTELQSFVDMQKGLKKPSNISFQTLRNLARTLPAVAVCKNTLKHEITKIEWGLVPLGKQNTNESHYEEVRQLLKHPNRNKESFRTILDMVTEDILDLDAGCIEKVRNGAGKIAELWYRDGATIRPMYTENGIVGDPAYAQYISPDPKPKATWNNDDMIYMRQNPQGSLEAFGYGLSPVESVAMAVTYLLLAEQFNASYFNNTSIPPAIINLGAQATKDQLEQFKASWMAMLSGANSQWRTPIIASDTLQYQEIRKGNQDMQFMEYIQWLTRMVVAAFEMSPQDIGMTADINRATAEVQQNISSNKGLKSLLNLWREYINEEIIADFGYQDEFTFEWVGVDALNPMDQMTVATGYVMAGIKSGNEVRISLGDDPIKGLEKPFIMSKSGPVFFDATPLEDLSDSEISDLRSVADRIIDEVATPQDYKVTPDEQAEAGGTTNLKAPANPKLNTPKANLPKKS